MCVTVGGWVGAWVNGWIGGCLMLSRWMGVIISSWMSDLIKGRQVGEITKEKDNPWTVYI